MKRIEEAMEKQRRWKGEKRREKGERSEWERRGKGEEMEKERRRKG